MGIQALHLWGQLPNWLELSSNICTQRCDYCYAKTWKKESVPLSNVINEILRLEQKDEGLVPFLLRKRMPISLSNRTDVMSAPDWRERLGALKELGFPIYLETKLNKDYKDLVNILDPKIDHIYQTVTGFNNKHEEHNLLSAEEKIEAGKWLNEQGFHHILAVNPYLPDKVSVEEIKKMIDIVKPYGFVMRDYHTTSKSIDKHLFMPEFPKDECEKTREDVRKYCREKKIYHDIDTFEKNPYPELNLRMMDNYTLFGGHGFVLQEFLIEVNEMFKNHPEVDTIDIELNDFLDFYKPQREFFKDCIFKKSDYSIVAGKSPYSWKHERFGIDEFLTGMFNAKKLNYIFDYYSDLDRDGNMIYTRNRNGFAKGQRKRTKVK